MGKNPNIKVVSFRQDEQELLEFIENKYFSAYVKELIKKDMLGNLEYNRTPPTPTKKRNTNFNMPED